MKEMEEDLTLFLEMQKREIERNSLLLQKKSRETSVFAETRICKSPISRILSLKSRGEDFIDSENDKSEYDWLLTPPRDPIFTSLDKKPRKMMTTQITNASTRPTSINCRVENPLVEAISRGNVSSRQQVLSASLNFSGAVNKRSSSSGRAASISSRPVTPTSRSTLPSNARTSRPSTPTSRTTYPSAKPTGPVRASTPTRPMGRSSTPTSRISAAAKSTSRSATPTRRSSGPSSVSSISAPSGRSSSVTKSVPTVSKNQVPSRGNSPTVKSRPWEPFEMPGFTFEAPPNLKTSLPDRPASASRGRPTSASRGRPAAPSARMAETGRTRQQSSSPSRARALAGNSNGSRASTPVFSRGHSNADGNDYVNHVVVGTKMVDRVVNMRKLAPPKQDDNHMSQKTFSGKSSSSSESLGFGRSLSKISLDMALRHMDIGRSKNLHPLITKIPASSMYSVRSGQTSSRTNSVSSSPLATRSSSASSEPSVNNNNSHYSEGSEVEDSDLGSERGGQLSPAADHGR